MRISRSDRPRRRPTPNTDPWRVVTEASHVREGRLSFLSGDTSRRARFYQLTLACGHETIRRVRYPSNGRGRGGSGVGAERGLSEALPPPLKVRCEECANADIDGDA